MSGDTDGTVRATPGLRRGSLPGTLEALAVRALEDDGAAEALAEALVRLTVPERAGLTDVLAGCMGDRFGRLLARLVGASASARDAQTLAKLERSADRAFRDGDRVFLVRGGTALEVARARVAVHDTFRVDGLEAQPLEPAIDEAARLLWRHHRGALPLEARRFAGLFDPAPPRSARPVPWRS